MMMMTSYDAPGYGATGTPSYLDQYHHHPYAWQVAGLGYQRLQQQHQQQLQQQQQQKFEQQFEQQRLQQSASQHAGQQHYYGEKIHVKLSCSNAVKKSENLGERYNLRNDGTEPFRRIRCIG